MYTTDICPICREETENTELRTLSCNHVFHKTCVDSWLCRVPSCPMCRTQVVVENVTPSATIIEVEYDSIEGEIGSVYFPDTITYTSPADDDIDAWVILSRDAVLTLEDMYRFMRTVRYNFPSVSEDILYNFSVYQILSEEFVREYIQDLDILNILTFQVHLGELFLLEIRVEHDLSN